MGQQVSWHEVVVIRTNSDTATWLGQFRAPMPGGARESLALVHDTSIVAHEHTGTGEDVHCMACSLHAGSASNAGTYLYP